MARATVMVSSASGAGGGAASPGVNVVELAVSADTVIAPPEIATAGQILVYFITMGATPRSVMWGSITGSVFKSAPPVPSDAGMFSVLVFVGRADGNWWPFQLLGVHP